MINLHRADVVLLWVFLFVPLELCGSEPSAAVPAELVAQAEPITPASDGTGTKVTPHGNQLEIGGGTQAGDNLFHSFEQFNLSPEQTANFISNPTIQNILGRVVGGDASVIQGLIQVTGANSNLFLMNPSGIIFAATAQLNVPASFSATTATAIGFDNQTWFNATGSTDYTSLMGAPSRFSFSSRNPNIVFNAGNLSVGQGQSLALLGGTVVNTGTLSAPGGRIAIAAIPSEGIVRVTPQGSLLSLDLPISKSNQSLATGTLAETVLPELLTGGVLSNATGSTIENGVIKLTPSSPPVPIERGMAIIASRNEGSASGRLSVTSSQLPTIHTPSIQVFGEKIALLNAQLDASTPTSGGTVLIGGDYQGKGSLPHAQFVFGDAETQINANALQTGRGGTVVLWSDQATRFQGGITAKGGQVETSGKASLDVTGARVSAGSWLLDPSDINIANGGSGTPISGIFDPLAAMGTIDPTTIAAAMNNGTNVTLTTAGGGVGQGDITLTDSINQTGGGTASLTLTGRRFNHFSNAIINLSSLGDLTFNLNQVAAEANAPNNSIQNAINSIGNTNGNRTINLGAGTYSGAPLILDRSVNLQGAPTATLTGSGTARVLEVKGNVNATLQNLTITGGQTTSVGGGIYVSGANSNLTIRDSQISGNRATYGGGISTPIASIVNIFNSTISNNTATNGGGGLENTFGAKLNIADSVISNNTAQYAGGISLFQSRDATITNSTISDNTAVFSGAGIQNDQTNLTVIGGSILRNRAGANGGGFYNLGVADIRGTTISNNIAKINGGGIENESVMIISNSFITNNNAGQDGGGIYNQATLILSDSKLSNNAAISGSGYGGGLTNNGSASELSILRTDFTDNRARTGGAIVIFGDRFVNIRDSSISGNSATEQGGGIFSIGNNLYISGSTIFNNQAATSGGGLAAFGTTAIDTTTISQNQAKTDGGGLHLGNTTTIIDSNITNNQAGRNGGGIQNSGANVTLRNSTLFNNRALIQGGGINNTNTGQLQLLDSTVLQNIAQGNPSPGGGNAGGIYTNGPTTILRSLIEGNKATGDGGGIFSTAPLNLTNVTISGNSATEGGGIYSSGTTLIRNNTLTNNQANNAGGGIFNRSGSAQLQNTIIAGNRSASSPDVAGLFTDQGNNLIGIRDGSTGFTKSTLVGTATNPIDPLLEALANNGGFSQTHALLPRSPAVNAGNNAIATPTDQRGAPRIQQTVIDIGAFESNSSPPTSPIPSPTPTPSPTPSVPPPGAVKPTDLTGQNQPNLETKPPIEAPQPLSIVGNLDQSLSNDYEQYYGLDNAPKLGLQEIEATLSQVQKQKNVRSVVVYAIFTPQTIAPAPKNGERYQDSVEPVTPFLRSKLKRNDDRLDLVLVAPTGEAIRYSTTATRAQVLQQAKLFRLAVSDVDDDQGYTALARQLYGWLLQPLEAQLKRQQITSLIYCLDEGLRTIPIAAIADQQDYAIQRYTVSVIPSVSLVNREITDLRDRTLLAMGADQFSSLAPLPAVPTELQLVSEEFWKGKQFLNQEFTVEELLRQKRIENPGIIHLATHAQFNIGAPSQSYIQLWNTRINLAQMKSLGWANPPLELLVLSACDTAIGSTSAELGFAGLAAAAGVHSVMGSLWTVSDIGTLALMSEFYIQLQTAPTRSEALRRAQLALKNGAVRIENGRLITSQKSVLLPTKIVPRTGTILFTHPFYWSAFTLVGNPW
ncbi:MAG: CHAT domain-containing protein [Myxacorys californica WJT36-NPBG1]|jgi:filamentous hemagglutinin family protein|nr:CHAT domain-containing protein [Myxacorys californica WJT36-NPBG1]